jgi:hypothetical protein
VSECVLCEAQESTGTLALRQLDMTKPCLSSIKFQLGAAVRARVCLSCRVCTSHACMPCHVSGRLQRYAESPPGHFPTPQSTGRLAVTFPDAAPVDTAPGDAAAHLRGSAVVVLGDAAHNFPPGARRLGIVLCNSRWYAAPSVWRRKACVLLLSNRLCCSSPPVSVTSLSLQQVLGALSMLT